MSDVNQAHLEKIETLPKGWVDSSVSEIVKTISANNKKLVQKQYLKEGEFPVIDQGQEFIGGYSNDKDLVVEEEPPFIIFGDHTRAFKFINFQFVPGADGIKIMKPIGVDAKWCFYIFQAIKLPNKGYARHFQYLKEAYVPVPPPEQQKRIVAKIEELFSHIDAGIASLQAAKNLLKQYRQSVLKAAVTGELTKDWRKANKDKLEPASQLLERILIERRQRWEEQQLEQFKAKGKPPKDDKWKEKYKEPLSPEFEHVKKIPKIPNTWEWATINQLTTTVKDGPHYSPKYSEKGIPFITGGNVRPNGVDFKNCKFITKELHEELLKRCKPEIDDILYTKGGTTGIARVNTYDFEFNVWVHVSVLRLVNTGFIKPFYMQHALNSLLCYSQSQRYTHGVGNQDLGLTRIIKICLALPSPDEQQNIIEAIDRKMESIIRIENQVEHMLNISEKSKQSILASAFKKQIYRSS